VDGAGAKLAIGSHGFEVEISHRLWRTHSCVAHALPGVAHALSGVAHALLRAAFTLV
jgi:hypothetical protein